MRMTPSRDGLWACALLISLAASVTLAGCGGGESAQAQRPSGPGNGEGRPEQPPVPVTVEPASRGTITTSYAATATLEAEKQAEILARVAGVVQRIPAEEGDLVTTGTALLHIENDEYRLRVQQAQADRERLGAMYERQAQMVAQSLISQETYDDTRTQLEAAEAGEELARLNLSYTTVEAPFEGVIVRRLVDAGQTVQVGTPLFELADFSPLLARIHVPAKEFRRLQADQPVRLTIDSDGTELSGHIRLISPTIDPQTGTIKLTVEIHSYPAHVRPGDFAHASVTTERRENALLVPRPSVMSEKGEDVVFVVVGDVAERRVVELGFLDAEHAEILSGVQEGEQVVSRGQRTLKHGSPVRILEDGFAAPGENAS